MINTQSINGLDIIEQGKKGEKRVDGIAHEGLADAQEQAILVGVMVTVACPLAPDIGQLTIRVPRLAL